MVMKCKCENLAPFFITTNKTSGFSLWFYQLLRLNLGFSLAGMTLTYVNVCFLKRSKEHWRRSLNNSKDKLSLKNEVIIFAKKLSNCL